MIDNTAILNEQIKAAALQLEYLCGIHNVPFFLTIVEKADSKEGVKYYNLMQGTVSCGLKLPDDQILKHINVANGFDTCPKRDKIDFDDFDDLEDYSPE